MYRKQEFDNIVFTELLEGIYNIIRKYSISYYNSNVPHYEMGVYVYTTYIRDMFQTVHIVFHAPNGSWEAKDFMDAVHTDIENLCIDTFEEKFFYYHILTGIVNWTVSRCDIRTACESLYPDGIIIRCDDTFEYSTIRVVNGIADRD